MKLVSFVCFDYFDHYPCWVNPKHIVAVSAQDNEFMTNDGHVIRDYTEIQLIDGHLKTKLPINEVINRIQKK